MAFPNCDFCLLLNFPFGFDFGDAGMEIGLDLYNFLDENLHFIDYTADLYIGIVWGF